MATEPPQDIGASGGAETIPGPVRPLLLSVGRVAEALHYPAYAVGGCVRDWRLGMHRTVDLDVTVEGDGVALARHVAQALAADLTVHAQFKTATVLTREPAGRRRILRIDFATCRRETYAEPAAYPRVTPGTLEEDLFRRDFTINAMAISVAPGRFGVLIDPFGGARDLGQQLLRVLHQRSFVDDPSRILRGIRFAERFGLRWEPSTERAARAAVAEGLLGRLNAGRLRKELERMCDEPHPLRCLRALAGVLQHAGAGP